MQHIVQLDGKVPSQKADLEMLSLLSYFFYYCFSSAKSPGLPATNMGMRNQSYCSSRLVQGQHLAGLRHSKQKDKQRSTPSFPAYAKSTEGYRR